MELIQYQEVGYHCTYSRTGKCSPLPASTQSQLLMHATKRRPKMKMGSLPLHEIHALPELNSLVPRFMSASDNSGASDTAPRECAWD